MPKDETIEKFSRNDINILWLTGVGHGGCHLAMLIFPTAAVFLVTETGIPIDTVLGWSFIGYAIFGLAAIPIGLLADKISSKLMLRIGVLGTGPALMAVAQAARRCAPRCA